MVLEGVVRKAVDLPEKLKARAWNYLMGYLTLHMMHCTDEACIACRGVNRAMTEGLEENN